jgi:hypothetical protein
MTTAVKTSDPTYSMTGGIKYIGTSGGRIVLEIGRLEYQDDYWRIILIKKFYADVSEKNNNKITRQLNISLVS